MVRTDGPRPPGTSTFNIEPLAPNHESDEFVEVLDSLPVGSMAFEDYDPPFLHPSNKWMEYTAPVIFGPLSDWREQYPRWNDSGVWARRQLGDGYALVADAILTLAQPFPGDESYDSTDLRPELRFRIIRCALEPEYIIQDYLTHEDVVVPKSLLQQL